MSVKLSYAADGQRLIHISEPLIKDKIYKCPFCDEQVNYRKGNSNEHHYYHKPHSNCSASAESILHFEAKHFLFNEIRKGDVSTLSLSFEMTSFSTLITAISNILSTKPLHDVDLHKLTRYFGEYNIATVEKKVGPYIADVVAGSKLVFEIFVTHESGEEKLLYFRENRIPFVELVPSRERDGCFSFQVHEWFLPSFFEKIEQKYEQKLSALLVQQLDEKVNQLAEKKVERIKEIEMKIQALQKLQQDISSLQFNIQSESKNPMRVQAKRATVIGDKPLENIDIHYKKTSSQKNYQERYLKVNHNTYYVSGVEDLLCNFLTQCIQQYGVKALIGGWDIAKDHKVVGFEVGMPDLSDWEKQAKDSIRKQLREYEEKFEQHLKKFSNTIK